MQDLTTVPFCVIGLFFLVGIGGTVAVAMRLLLKDQSPMSIAMVVGFGVMITVVGVVTLPATFPFFVSLLP